MKNHDSSYTINYIIRTAEECLNGKFHRRQYVRAIVPLTFIARIDAVLESTKPDVLAALEQTDAPDRNALCKAARQPFYNTSPLNLSDIIHCDKELIAERFNEYMDGFSENVAEILELFGFRNVVERLAEAEVLGELLERFTSKWIGLSPEPTYKNFERTDVLFPGSDSREMGALLIEIAGRLDERVIEGQTPKDVARLMAELVFTPAAENISDGEYSVYDGTCGLGELISASDKKLRAIAEASGKAISAHIYGQEPDPQFYALCKAAFLLNEENTTADIAFGSALSADDNTESKFDFMISCPPHGKSWKADYDKMSTRGRVEDERFIDNLDAVKPRNMLPGTRDGQLLYLLNNVSKMKESPLGSRIVEVHSGSLLFSGNAGSAESNARRYLIERDLIEAIIALPKNIFFGTANPAFILVLSNRKEERRKGKVQLINASAMKSPPPKNIGRKNCELDENIRAEIMRIYSGMEESEVSHIIDGREFEYWSLVVEKPLRQRVEINTATIKDTLSMFKTLYGVDTDHEDDDIPEVGLVDLFSFTEKNPKARTIKTPKTWGEVQFEQVYNVYMKILIDMMSEEPYMDYNAFLERFNAHPLHKKNPTNFSDFEDFMFPLLTKDPAAAIVMRNGKPVPDEELRVVKTVPFTYDGGLDGFIRNEILPQDPDAIVYPNTARTGCEINFSKYFYKPRTLRGTSEIINELKRLESEIAELKNSSAAEAILRHAEKTHIAESASSVALESAASEQLIRNAGFAERNVLALVNGKIVRKDVDLSGGKLPAAYENYQLVFPGNIILRLTEFRGGQTELRTALVAEQGIISSSYLCLKAAENILPEYLHLQLHIADISGMFLELGGGLRCNLGFKDIAKLPIRLVPLDEQKAVVENIHKTNAPITAAIDKLNKAVSALRELENSLILDLLR